MKNERKRNSEVAEFMRDLRSSVEAFLAPADRGARQSLLASTLPLMADQER